MPIDRDDEEVVKTEVRQELKLDDKTDENNLDTQVSEKVETFEAKVDKGKANSWWIRRRYSTR